MNLDEALAHVEDATPHEDVEAWIAQVLAAAVRRVLAECDRREQYIVENVPDFLQPDAAVLTVADIRALLRGPS